MTPVSATGYAADSGAGLPYASDHHGAVSPGSISSSTVSAAYASGAPARVMSPSSQRPMTGLQTGPSDRRVSLPHHPHEGSGHWQGGPHHMPSSQQYQKLGSQSARASWDMGTYLTNSPASAGGTSTSQSLNYASPRHVADTASPGGDNNIAQRTLSAQHSPQHRPLQRHYQQQQSHQMPRT